MVLDAKVVDNGNEGGDAWDEESLLLLTLEKSLILEAIVLNVKHGLVCLARTARIVVMHVVIDNERYIALLSAEAALWEVLLEESPIQVSVAVGSSLSISAVATVALVCLVSRDQTEVI